MKKILVAVDYSENAQNALNYAFEIARIAGAELYLIHAFYPIMSPPAAHSAADVTQALEEGKGRSLLEFAEQTRQNLTIESGEAGRFSGVTIKAFAKMGGSYEKILEAIDRYTIDLVVMGMQGGEAVSQALLGSTTISVMQKSRVPVLAVPSGLTFNQFATIVFAINLSKIQARADLRFVSDFVKTFKANLQVLHLYRNETQQQTFDATYPLQLLTEQFKEIPYTFNFDVKENVAQGIQDFIRTEKADLLVLIPQKHTMLERLLDKSVTGRITAHPQVPLLALPPATLHPQVTNPESMVTQGQL
ncbi:universal stress protein [Pontibacter burrus]|uniref:Universal stress protein n=1 Tax=Pontibacter burrus TaxID=2704466 RepID=A0A6B3LKR5_9BACT|nr:universal stress protein [Pontibacter burrus]NEM97532.1 universal stress protein [Pontibacter burrus]